MKSFLLKLSYCFKIYGKFYQMLLLLLLKNYLIIKTSVYPQTNKNY